MDHTITGTPAQTGAAHLASPGSRDRSTSPLSVKKIRRKTEKAGHLPPVVELAMVDLAFAAIANSRLIAFDNNGVTFRYKDYRADGRRIGAEQEQLAPWHSSFRIERSQACIRSGAGTRKG